MAHPGRLVNVLVNAGQTFQQVDGFGVNINSRYFDHRLMPAMDLLVNDLGATLFRVDIWGKSNWIDPTGQAGRSSLDPVYQAKIFAGEVFQRGWEMMRWLNERGIQPYLTASGIVPEWMLGADGKTLADYEAFTGMMVEMLYWAKNQERLDFHLFGPLNETDLGDPEGPTVLPEGYVKVCERLVEKLDGRGLGDIQLVVAEQSQFNTDYLRAFTNSQSLVGRIGAFAMHDYSDFSKAQYEQVVNSVQGSPYAHIPLWMTEYGDLEQTGEREWYVAWAMTSRLMDHLEHGFRASLVWDAYDNYHDHDEHWTIYGLLRTGLRAYTPKKRYYASKQVFRYVLPGFIRIGAVSESPEVRMLAFFSPDGSDVTLVGMNLGDHPANLNINLKGWEHPEKKLSYYRTSETENCYRISNTIPLVGGNWPFTGIDVGVPPASIFTITSL